MRTVTVTTRPGGKFTQTVKAGDNEVISDEPKDLGGDDTGLAPFDLVLSGLGSCTSMTLSMYAGRKGWPLTSVHVELEGAMKDGRFEIARRIRLEGDLSEEQRQGLLLIANKCPVHKALSGPIAIASSLVDQG